MYLPNNLNVILIQMQQSLRESKKLWLSFPQDRTTKKAVAEIEHRIWMLTDLRLGTFFV